MTDLLTLQPSDFTGLLGGVFRIAAAPPVELRLREVKLLGQKRPDAPRDPFSLAFTGSSGLRIPQGIHRLECSALGGLEVFMVQVGDGPQESEFEVVFT